MSKLLEQQSKDIAEQARQIGAEIEGQTRIIATLVELEFMQQSMDLQDEEDRHKIHLYGLNDTKFTIEDFMEDQPTKSKNAEKSNKKKV